MEKAKNQRGAADRVTTPNSLPQQIIWQGSESPIPALVTGALAPGGEPAYPLAWCDCGHAPPYACVVLRLAIT